MIEPKKHLHVKTGDTVVVISGKDKGKQGKIQKAFPQKGTVVVEGVAMVKRHQKPRGQAMPGGIMTKESPIPASRVLPFCSVCGRPRRVAHKFIGDALNAKKVRVCCKCGASFDK